MKRSLPNFNGKNAVSYSGSSEHNARLGEAFDKGEMPMIMKLRDFIKEAIVQIMQGMNAADGELKHSRVGSIYKDEYKGTMAQALVNLGIVKGKGDKGILVVGFDVAVAVQEESEQSDRVNAGVGVPLLAVIGFKAGIEGQSGQTQTTSNSHRITFSLPVSFDTFT